MLCSSPGSCAGAAVRDGHDGSWGLRSAETLSRSCATLLLRLAREPCGVCHAGDVATPDPAGSPPASSGRPVQRTPDGHHLVVDGRRWRASDPRIPETLRTELVGELMAARRAVRDADGDEPALARARSRVQDAKVALGERGEAWWEPPTTDGLRERLAAAMRTLLRRRKPESTICPSDAARVAGGEAWRDAMEPARSVAVELAAGGLVEVRQRGVRVDPATATGALRLARGPAWPLDY